MSAIRAFVAALAAVLAAACAPEAAPAPVGVGPASNPPAQADARTKVELERPEPPPLATVPTPAPEAAPEPAAKSGVIGPDIADLGPFEVMSWQEAKARAEKQIQPDTADLELEKLRNELENRP